MRPLLTALVVLATLLGPVSRVVEARSGDQIIVVRAVAPGTTISTVADAVVDDPSAAAAEAPSTTERATDSTPPAVAADDADDDSGRWVRAGLVGLLVGLVIGVFVARRNRSRRFGGSRVP